jgi:hypothetical protein
MKRRTIHKIFFTITVLIVLPFFTFKDLYPFFRFGMFARYTPQPAPRLYRLVLISKGYRSMLDYDAYNLQKTQIESLGLKYKDTKERMHLFLKELHEACKLSKADTLEFEAETVKGETLMAKFPK